ncbi:PepSY-associated TM helix domain-containing protein [Roseiterribacter gracilis]|uniref:PepSY domain-containing protein n=1 Tax=Roseiterribacter gracilis TaxID=2812848 RepID=A0A8S8X6X0_9PROT|nr:hypothetical protein TMPK1_13550 [Rhodospirillales bacterium TMPK1]
MSKATLLRLHKWCGLSLCILLLLQACTGLLMAHREWLRPLLHSHSRIEPGRPMMPLDQLFAGLQARFPEHRLERLVQNQRDDVALLARFYKAGRRDLIIADVDPATGVVLGSGPLVAYPLQLAERLHVSLLIGTTGSAILVAEGLGLAFMAISGVLIWWPRTARLLRALRIHWRGSTSQVLRDLHVVPGALIAPLLVLSSLTGVLIIADPLTHALVGSFAKVNPEISLDLPPATRPNQPMSWQVAYEQMRARFPDSRLRQIRPLDPQGRTLGVLSVAQNVANPRAHDMALVDRWTGALVVFSDGHALPPGQAALDWIMPLHTGEAYGPLRPLLMTLSGGGLATLTVTGAWMWLRQRARRSMRAAQTVAAASRNG